jgi:hypothetical protein
MVTICVLLSLAGVGRCSDANVSSGVSDVNGPTALLSYNEQIAAENPTSSFMYFVPLISPTMVDMETSADNRQRTNLISYKKKATSESFHVSCEFEMAGEGFFKTTFNAPEVIEIVLDETEKGEPMTKALDYIKFEGEGFGCIEAWGTVSGSTKIVNEVTVHFNARGHKSPVTFGLYDIKPVNGQYKYENKYNEIVARVNTLTFRKCEGTPTMGVKLASVGKAAKPNGFMSKVKGTIANLFIDPPMVSRFGNQTMLDFGLALLEEKPSFTFPRATNIKASSAVAIDKNK